MFKKNKIFKLYIYIYIIISKNIFDILNKLRIKNIKSNEKFSNEKTQIIII